MNTLTPHTSGCCRAGLVSHQYDITLSLVGGDDSLRMVLLYQLDCNKVLDLLEDNVAVSEEQFSDYWENNLR